MSAAGAPPVGDVRLVDDVPAAFASVVVDAFGQSAGRRDDGHGGGGDGPGMSLALSGGETARACYEHLAASPGGAIDWARVTVYMGDERCVPPDDPDANQRLVREALLDRVGPVTTFHPMSCDDGAEAYQALVAPALPFDLVHLGLGPDGHTASLFPRSVALDAPGGTLVLVTEDPNGRNPHARMTLTLPAINACRLAVFTVSGESKRDAWAQVCAGADLPANRVRAASVLWLVDHAAAGA